MKKLFIIFLLLFSFPIFAENLRHLPFNQLLTTIDKQCRNGNKKACESLYVLYYYGNETVNILPNKEKQQKYDLIRCQLFNDCVLHQEYIVPNYQKLCTDNANKNLSLMGNCIRLFREEKDKKQSSEITNYIEKQCQEKQFWACFSIFRYYEVKEDKQNLAKYDLLLEQSATQKCEKENYPFVCEMFDSTNKRRNKPIKYHQKWTKLYQKICDEQSDYIGVSGACYLYALNTTNEQETKQYLDKGCHLKEDDSCMALASIYFVEKNNQLSQKYFGKACDLGNINGCIAYQNLDKIKWYQIKRKKQFNRDIKNIIHIYTDY